LSTTAACTDIISISRGSYKAVQTSTSAWNDADVLELSMTGCSHEKNYLPGVFALLAFTVKVVVKVCDGGTQFLSLRMVFNRPITLVPAVGAYSRDSGFTSMVEGLCIAPGMSPVSGAPCGIRRA
jgi:hypothetical protein